MSKRSCELAPDFVLDVSGVHDAPQGVIITFPTVGERNCLHGSASAVSALTVNDRTFGSFAIALTQTDGVYVPLDAKSARVIASALFNLADHLDGGSGKQ